MTTTLDQNLKNNIINYSKTFIDEYIDSFTKSWEEDEDIPDIEDLEKVVKKFNDIIGFEIVKVINHWNNDFPQLYVKHPNYDYLICEIIIDAETKHCYIELGEDEIYGDEDDEEEYLAKLEQILDGKKLTDYEFVELIIKIRENIN